MIGRRRRLGVGRVAPRRIRQVELVGRVVRAATCEFADSRVGDRRRRFIDGLAGVVEADAHSGPCKSGGVLNALTSARVASVAVVVREPKRIAEELEQREPVGEAGSTWPGFVPSYGMPGRTLSVSVAAAALSVQSMAAIAANVHRAMPAPDAGLTRRAASGRPTRMRA